MLKMKKKVLALTGLAVIALNSVVFYAASAASTPKSVATSTAIKAAKWNPTVKLTYSKSSVLMQPTGIPNHARDAYYAVPNAGIVVPDATTANIIKDPTKAQSYNFTIPTTPKYSSKVTSTSLGSIGVMISGAVLYNPFEGDGKTVAMANNFTITNSAGITASFVDKCTGHPTPGQGAYHYHGLPSCVTAKVDKVSKPSHIIGFALDGFPIYGDRDNKGKQVTAKNLDKCNGVNSATPEFPKGIYHYVLLGTADARSSIACFHGEVDASQIQAMPAMGGGGMPMPDTAAAAMKLGITEDALKAALGTNMPPDIAAAAKNLGVTEAVLLDALGIQAKP
ncbi:MAG: YHYH protein [Actinobacteria bacterium]|nr:YHYH protein [Actinomycetota bacterium]